MFLDPYHRIRATVAVLFALCVMAMAIVTPHGRRHPGTGVTTSVVAAPAVVSPGVVARHARTAGAKRRP